MNNIHKRRLYIITSCVLGLALATALILYALKQNINAFLTPSQLLSQHLPPDYHLRLGGIVQPGSVLREKNTLGVQFIITDFKKTIPVHYVGILPDLFREGKGVIAEGYLNAQGILMASQILAKHDENYMPKNVYQALRENVK
jgi:cytochrome c-type biogenesis protein CcmE